MIRFALRPAALAAGLFVCSAALADDVDVDIVKAQAGTYLIASASGEPGCRITLESGNAIGGYSLSGADDCVKPLPALAEAYAWNFDSNGGLILLDATRKVLARFVENEGSPLETEDEQPLFMLDAPKGVDRLPTFASLAGNWTLQRPTGEKLCTLILTNAKDKDGNSPLSPSGDCAPAVARLNLAVFSVEGFGLVLMSKDGASLSFDMLENGNFEKSPEDGGKPLLMIKNP
ncbi:AprI/Inh family metalloprotease inhibitor [Rhizobium sp. 18055]|uniref:AprI/Inh family metalloprotease inhibitor n=1 Tax=Rhizobium sp. 18055 TaxID=2681403 RepID=UPI00135C19BD|nr:AprI/Inh family metalloprotease inhibitor [Rhizobium sp. 18055]